MTRGKIELKPATSDDYNYFYNTPRVHTIRAWTGWLNGDRVGIGGFVTYNKVNTLFFHVPNIECYNKLTLWRAIRKGVNRIKKTGLDFVAIRDTKLNTSYNFLSYFGFMPSYIVGDMEVWQ